MQQAKRYEFYAKAPDNREFGPFPSAQAVRDFIAQGRTGWILTSYCVTP